MALLEHWVGTTFGSLGTAIFGGLVAGMSQGLAGPWSRLEQLVFFAIAGAVIGVVGGIVVGGSLGFLLGTLFHWSRMRQSLLIYWAGITTGALAGSLAGFGGGMLLGHQLTGADQLIWSPLGALLGGIFGALAGRKWVAIVAGKEVTPFNFNRV